jgi:SAM-dependent methyltransferase
MDFSLSPLNPNTRDTYEEEYQEGGLYDHQGGSRQTYLFARYFHRHFRVPLEWEFTVLDMGCALGDALPVWRQHYRQQARFCGCDVSPTAIRRAKEKFGNLADFFVGGFEELNQPYDVIYCSNVLEHFEAYEQIATHLLKHCKILYVITPFNELKKRSPMRLKHGKFHVTSFYQDSFDFLTESGLAAKINTKVFRAPGAWSWTFKYRCYRLFRSSFLGDPIEQEPLQIGYEIFAR